MNSLLTENVVAPPIVAFKQKARSVSPKAPVFDMSQAVPAFPTFQKIRSRLADALMDDGVSFYTDVPGLATLRRKICRTHPLSESMLPENLLITAGANHAMYTALTLHFDIGDTVLLIEPYYFNYDMALKMLGLKPEYFQFPGGRFDLTADELIEHLGRSKAKGLILISPNNPTGACYSPREIKMLLDWTSSRGIHVILDETYLRFDPNHLSDRTIGPFIENGLSLVGSFSKSFSLTGYRVGYLAASRQAIQESLKIQDTLVICAPHIAQLAALFGLENCSEDVAAKASELQSLKQTLLRRAQELRRFQLTTAGAFFAYLKHPFENVSASGAALKLYENAGIFGLPGSVFGATQERYIRLAFCNLTEQDLNLAMDQLIQYDRMLA